jgi:ATP-dependent DNA helicase RecG
LRIWQNDGKNDGKNLFNKDLSENEKRVLLELINNPSILYDPLVVKLKISKRTVSRVFESLVKKRYIQRVGSNKKGYWKVIK